VHTLNQQSGEVSGIVVTPYKGMLAPAPAASSLAKAMPPMAMGNAMPPMTMPPMANSADALSAAGRGAFLVGAALFVQLLL